MSGSDGSSQNLIENKMFQVCFEYFTWVTWTYEGALHYPHIGPHSPVLYANGVVLFHSTQW